MLSVVITRFIRWCFDDCLNLVVIPAPEPGSIGGGGVLPLPKMDPGSGAGMTTEWVKSVYEMIQCDRKML